MKKIILILMVCLLPFAVDGQVKSSKKARQHKARQEKTVKKSTQKKSDEIKVTELTIIEDNPTPVYQRQYDSDMQKGTEDRTVTRVLPADSYRERRSNLSEEIFIAVEQMPQFPGGEAALMKFLQSNVNYPPTAAERDIQGRVVVMFVVEKTGQVGEVKVARSVDPELDAEAVRLCRLLPNFIPGRQNGQPVNVLYTMPVTFRLQSAKDQTNHHTNPNVGPLARLQQIVKEMNVSLPSFLDDGSDLWDVRIEDDFLVITIDVINDVSRLQDLQYSAIINDISYIEFGDFIVHNKNEKIKKLVKPW